MKFLSSLVLVLLIGQSALAQVMNVTCEGFDADLSAGQTTKKMKLTFTMHESGPIYLANSTQVSTYIGDQAEVDDVQFTELVPAFFGDNKETFQITADYTQDMYWDILTSLKTAQNGLIGTHQKTFIGQGTLIEDRKPVKTYYFECKY